MRRSWPRLIVLVALAGFAVVLAGCAGGDSLEALSKASSSEARVGDGLSRAGKTLNEGAAVDSAQLRSYSATIDQAQSDVSGLDSATLSAQQRDQVNAETAVITSTQDTVATEQAIVSDAQDVPQNLPSAREKLIKRALRRVCAAIRRAQGRSEPEHTQQQEESEVTGELSQQGGVEEPQELAARIIGHVQAIGSDYQQKLRELQNLNPPGLPAILQAAAARLACP